MKRTSDRRGPSAASLRAIPPLDFSKYGAPRKNPFAARLKRDGYALPAHEPSAESLRDIPPIDFAKVEVRKNPYAEKIRKHGYELALYPGRPRAGKRMGPTVAKAVRLPPNVWRDVEARARKQGLSVHAFIRLALLERLADGRSQAN